MESLSSCDANIERPSNDTTVEAKQYTRNNVAGIRTSGKQKNKTQELLHYRTDGAMAIQGQLYEIKLLTLFLLRFLNNNIQFYLGANITGVGALDDLCFKYKPANSNRHVTVFLQAKHKSNPDKGKLKITDLQSYDGDFSVLKHFDSFLMIRQKFTPKSKDILFRDTYHDSQCHFVLYTSLKHNIKSKRHLERSAINSDVEELIKTSDSGDTFQLEFEDFEYLTKHLVEKNIRQLGKKFFTYVMEERSNESGSEPLSSPSDMMDEKLMKMYNLVITQSVVEEVTNDANGVRYKFRSDFFDTKGTFATIFREFLYDEAVTNKDLNTLDKDIISKVVADTTAENISKIIGILGNYDQETNRLLLIEDHPYKNLVSLDGVKVESTVIRNAINIRGRQLLEGLEFTFDNEFGWTDMKYTGDSVKIESRRDFLVASFLKLFESAKPSWGINFVDVDDSMVGPKRLVARGVVEHDGGLGSALGNLLVVDRDTGALKFNTSSPLPDQADALWKKLKQNHDEDVLATYRFKFCVDGFPKTSFEDVSYEEYLARDFIGRYWLCTGQAKEDAVGTKAMEIINKNLKIQKGKKSVLRAKSYAIFLILQDRMKDWWSRDKENYLTQDTTYLQDAMSEVVNDLLTSILSRIYVNKLRTSAVEFAEDAVKSLGLDEAGGLVLIVTNSIKHTAVKLMQYYTNSHCTFIDFNYVKNLMFFDLANELIKSEKKAINNTEKQALVITCKATDALEMICEALSQFIQDVTNMSITVVTDAVLAVALKQELTCAYHEVRDDRNGFKDLSLASKQKILDEFKVVYQGEEVALKTIIKNDTEHLITTHVLESLENKEEILIGKSLNTSSYNNLEHIYIERCLTQPEMSSVSDNSHEDKLSDSRRIVKTLNDFDQSIIVVTAPAGMGKSTFLTHLSLETKKVYPNVWIARINLLDHSKQFQKWQQSMKTIGRAEILSFLCQAVASTKCPYKFKNTANGVVLNSENISATDLLEAELFIHSYNNGEVIFIFDGFDEICPLYEREVIQLMKATATSASSGPRADTTKKPKLWIASRSYNNVKHVIEREFGISYGLEPLSAIDQSLYLEKYWTRHMKLERFTFWQVNNVTSLMQFMSDYCDNYDSAKSNLLKPITFPLHEIFLSAIRYFLDQINKVKMSASYLQYKIESWRDVLYCATFTPVEHDRTLQGSPLHLHIAAEYLRSMLFEYLPDNDRNRWNLDSSTFLLYKRFLVTKLTEIRMEEKLGHDNSKPDGKSIHDMALAEFLNMHRMLGFYALFNDEVEQIMSAEELGRVKCMTEEIKKASEKTGVIDCIVDDMPVFVHRTFAEYFAADYICEALKTAYTSQQLDTQKLIWEFILTSVIKHDTISVGGFVDHQLFNDDALKIRVKEEETERMVYECLKKLYARKDESRNDLVSRVPVANAVHGRLMDTSVFLFNTFVKYVQFKDVGDFIDLDPNKKIRWNDIREKYGFVQNLLLK